MLLRVVFTPMLSLHVNEEVTASDDRAPMQGGCSTTVHMRALGITCMDPSAPMHGAPALLYTQEPWVLHARAALYASAHLVMAWHGTGALSTTWAPPPWSPAHRAAQGLDALVPLIVCVARGHQRSAGSPHLVGVRTTGLEGLVGHAIVVLQGLHQPAGPAGFRG